MHRHTFTERSQIQNTKIEVVKRTDDLSILRRLISGEGLKQTTSLVHLCKICKDSSANWIVN